MGLIQNLLEKVRDKKRQREQYENGEHIQERFHERKKSGDERMLERYHEEARQKRITEAVKRLKKAENDQVWRGQKHNAVYAENFIKGGKNIFADSPSITKAPCLFGQTQTTRRQRKGK